MDFLAAARDRLHRLAATHADGTLDAAQYEDKRRAIEREVGDFLLSKSAANVRVRPSRGLVAGLAAVVIAVAFAGYLSTGSPMLARLGPAQAAPQLAAAPEAAASGGEAVGLQQIAEMVEKLATRMKDRPDDAEGWTMLARSYTVLGRFAEALPAYARATTLQPKNANLLADYADAVAATKGKVDNPESAALLARALAAEPGHPKALALTGTAAYDRGDYVAAIASWQKIVDRLPADSDLAKQVQASITEARGKAGSAGASAGVGVGVNGSAGVVASAPARMAGASSATAPAASALTSSVSGIVHLDPALQAQASPADTVFVFARAVPGGRMPVAILRAKVADLPLAFKLDDSMAMAPGASISTAERLVVGARISKSGNAMPQAGDLSGEAAAVAPGARGIEIRIGQTVGAR